MRFDENLTSAEIELVNTLKNKNRMEQDEIIGEYENGEL